MALLDTPTVLLLHRLRFTLTRRLNRVSGGQVPCNGLRNDAGRTDSYGIVVIAHGVCEIHSIHSHIVWLGSVISCRGPALGGWWQGVFLHYWHRVRIFLTFYCQVFLSCFLLACQGAWACKDLRLQEPVEECLKMKVFHTNIWLKFLVKVFLEKTECWAGVYVRAKCFGGVNCIYTSFLPICQNRGGEGSSRCVTLGSHQA